MKTTEPARVLVVDPPWSSDDALGNRGAAAHYPVLSLEDIKRFPLPDLLPDAVLFLWRLSSMPQEALDVVRAFGFVPKTELVWLKTTSQGNDAFGMGRILRGAHEVCVVATRGKVNPYVKNHSTRTHFSAPRGAHSEKPGVFYDIVRELFDGPRVALFERVEREGFECYGDELGRPHPSATFDPWARGRALVAGVERPDREVDGLPGVTIDVEIDAPKREMTVHVEIPVDALDPPKKKGRRSNAAILSDIANGLAAIGLTVSLVTIATWDRDTKNEVEDYIKEMRGLDGMKPQPPMPACLSAGGTGFAHGDGGTRDAGGKPIDLTEAAPKPKPGLASSHGVMHAPVFDGRLEDRDPTHEEWIEQALREDLISSSCIEGLSAHEAYCAILTRAPVGWFARAKVAILGMIDPGVQAGSSWERAAWLANAIVDREGCEAAS